MKRQYRFGAFTLDVIQRVLAHHGESLPLPPKVLETLLILVENHGRVVSKDELMRSVWPGISVGENSLSQNIFLLRKALGEGHIETVPKRGYRFTAPVQAVEPAAARTSAAWRWVIAAGIVFAAAAILVLQPRIGSASLSKPAPSSEAYQLYLRGRVQYLDHPTPEALKNSVESFERAIAKDPSFAPAWAGLADCYASVVFRGVYLKYREIIPKARAAALRAVALDDRLPEAHTALGNVKFRYDWDWAGAEREYKRALQLDPNFAVGHIQYGLYLAAMGRFTEGIAESNRAHELDPLSLSIQLLRGWNLALAGRYDEAIAQYQNILRRDPTYARAHQYLSFAYRDKGSPDEEAGEHIAWMAASGQSQTNIAALREAYRTGGMPGVLETTAELAHTPRQYKRLGDKEQAFATLERQFADRNPTLVFLKVLRTYDPLRSDPRYTDLLRRMALN